MSRDTAGELKILSTDRVAIAGLPGTGKSTLSKYFASLCQPKLLIYDPLSQYDNFPEECRYVPKTDSLAEFESICRRLRARANITFVIEEAERYIGQNKPLGENAFDLINRGRNWGIGVFAVTRRVQRISKDFFDLCQHCVFFKCGLKSRDYIAEMIGDEATRLIRQLEQYHFLHYDVQSEKYSIHVLKLGATQRIESKAAVKEQPEGAKEPEYDQARSERGVRPERDTASKSVERVQEPRR